MIWTTTPWTLPANRAISIAPDFDYALVQIDGQAVILAKDLVESVMQRIGVTDYTILGTVKGAELELLRFTHPFMGFDVPAGLNIAHMADVMDQKSVKLGTSSALCAWRSVAMARIAFQRALAFTS